MESSSFKAYRDSLIADLDRRVTDHILEPANAELLKKLIRKADTPDEAHDIAILGTTYKRTGFHFDKRLEPLSDTIHYFKKNEALSFQTDPSRPTHKLIIGDNYPALQNLLIEYRGRVNVIYIDPPYGKDSMGEFAKTNYQNAITRDNLLSMLYPRLLLAKQLLADDGVIFCSIDDRNQAYVKCLFDDVFEERNFVGTIIWQSATDNNPTQISTEHEYILCYGRNVKVLLPWFGESRKAELIEKQYLKLKQKELDDESIEKSLRIWIKDNIDELKGVAHYNNVDDKGVYSNSQNSSNTKPGGYMYDILHPVTGKPCAKPVFGWRWKEETFWNYAKKGDVEWGKDETTQPHIKKRLNSVTELLKSIYYEDGRVATSLLESLFGTKKIFDNPKPKNLISRLIDFSSEKDAIVLDFFAGSGTTGHAVLDLNADDQGKRQFILCQLKEESDMAPNGIAYDVTAERLKRIMTGTAYDGTSNFKWAKEHKPYGDNLDVYEIGEVSNSSDTEGKTPVDLIDETLYGLPPFKTMKEKMDWVCENFEHTQKEVEDDEDWEKRREEFDDVARS